MDLTNLNKDRKTRRKSTLDLGTMVYGKVPPQAKDLEEAVLGAIMLEKVRKNATEQTSKSQTELQKFIPIYGNSFKPSSFRKPLCLSLAAVTAFSISTSSSCVASRSISASPTAVLM